MGKIGRRRNKKKAGSNKNRILYGAAVGAVLLVVIVLLIAQNQSQSSQVIVDGARPSWQTIPLTEARTGETFELADFDDQNVFVKIMSPF